MKIKKAMSQDRLERLLKTLPPLPGEIFCSICADCGDPSPPLSVLRELEGLIPLCAMCASEFAVRSQISFANIERAVRMRRFFLVHRRRCAHCFKRASRWCEECGAPLCDSDATAIHRRRCIGLYVAERPDVYAVISPKKKRGKL